MVGAANIFIEFHFKAQPELYLGSLCALKVIISRG